jgi:peptidoglycan/LPS O-acetylase OafA/YrhL
MAVKTWPSRYELLDGLRGLAALAVVFTHLDVIGEGHFPVMVFFVISGYCITAAADSCRRQGYGFGAFMARRVKRIYPPYLLAILFYVATRAAKTALGGHDDLGVSTLDWVQNLTLTQWLSDLQHPISWPSANPHLFVSAFWSLDYEEQFYFVMAVGLFIATVRHVPLITGVLVLTVLGLVWNWSIPGNWVCGFFLEYWTHFALGACLYFALCVYTDRRSRGLFLVGVALLGAACAARLLPWTARYAMDLRSLVELAFLAAVTLGLYFLRPMSGPISRTLCWRPIAALGTISYSLYLIHQFNLTLIASIAHYIVPAWTPPVTVTAMEVALHLALASLFWYCCERPFLNRTRTSTPLKTPIDARTA